MPKIRSSADLRNNYNEISTFCHDYAEPVFITKNGYGDLVLMSMETYEDMFETARTDAAIAASEAEYKRNGRLHDVKDTFGELRSKYLG